MIKIWKFIKQAVMIAHKFIMCIVRVREFTRPTRHKKSMSLGGFLSNLLGY